MAKTEEAKKAGAGNWLNMKEPELFEKVRKAFERRNPTIIGLSLSAIVRIALTEWAEDK